jgi:hypothetical protein
METEVKRINKDRCINGVLATEAYAEIVADYNFKIQTLEFAITGLKKQDPIDEATIKTLELMLFETYAARAFLENDYRQYMKENEPLRSWIPPFRKECR